MPPLLKKKEKNGPNCLTRKQTGGKINQNPKGLKKILSTHGQMIEGKNNHTHNEASKKKYASSFSYPETLASESLPPPLLLHPCVVVSELRRLSLRVAPGAEGTQGDDGGVDRTGKINETPSRHKMSETLRCVGFDCGGGNGGLNQTTQSVSFCVESNQENNRQLHRPIVLIVHRRTMGVWIVQAKKDINLLDAESNLHRAK